MSVRKSRLMYFFAVLLGLIPMTLGGLASFQSTLMAEHATYATESMSREPASAPMSEDMSEALPPEIQAEIDRANAEPPLAMATASEPEGLSFENWMALVGTVNGMLFSWVGLILQRKEGAGLIKDAADSLRENDLNHMSMGDRLRLFAKSLVDKKTRMRYRLRKNANWSIYSAQYAVFDIPLIGRPIAVINRTHVAWHRIVAQFGDPSIVHGVEQMTMNACHAIASGAAAVDINDWRVTPLFDTPRRALDDAVDYETVIFLTLRLQDVVAHYTLITHAGSIPNDLESWELLIEGFRARYMKGAPAAVLEQAIAFYTPH